VRKRKRITRSFFLQGGGMEETQRCARACGNNGLIWAGSPSPFRRGQAGSRSIVTCQLDGSGFFSRLGEIPPAGMQCGRLLTILIQSKDKLGRSVRRRNTTIGRPTIGDELEVGPLDQQENRKKAFTWLASELTHSLTFCVRACGLWPRMTDRGSSRHYVARHSHFFILPASSFCGWEIRVVGEPRCCARRPPCASAAGRGPLRARHQERPSSCEVSCRTVPPLSLL
jgi:hypothetical protein